MYITLLIIVAFWLTTRHYLRGEDLKAYDQPRIADFGANSEPGPELGEVYANLASGFGDMNNLPRKEQLPRMREYMDNMSTGREFSSTFTPVDVAGVPAEWVVAPGADPSRRLLYIHGGAFTMGSPRSHRVVTDKFSELANAAVLAIDYRLMPENPRLASLQDCQTAWRWILDNGPDGSLEASWLGVAGDSAGGNLTLTLINWIRDTGLRRPDAAIALSPATDSTLSSPSARSNMQTDVMLKPMFEKLAKIPNAILLWGSWVYTRIRPCDPRISPIHDDLSNLPRTLVQASEVEILLDDAKRYVAKAQQAGSPAILQTWNHMPHVWQIFYPALPEAAAAFDEIAAFIHQESV